MCSLLHLTCVSSWFYHVNGGEPGDGEAAITKGCMGLGYGACGGVRYDSTKSGDQEKKSPVRLAEVLRQPLFEHLFFPFPRTDEIALVGTSTQGTSKSLNLYNSRKMAMKNIDASIRTFSDPQAFAAAAAASSAPAALTQVTELACIQEAGHLRCRFVPNLEQLFFNFQS
ncbi:hypothetical protein ACS0TY_002129 [Phlomoides rotata]